MSDEVCYRVLVYNLLGIMSMKFVIMYWYIILAWDYVDEVCYHVLVYNLLGIMSMKFVIVYWYIICLGIPSKIYFSQKQMPR